MDWDRYGVTGPWNRIRYDGSCRADDPAIVGPDGPATGAGSVYPDTLDPGVNTVEVCTPTADGFDLNTTQAVALPADTNAVRFAFGGIAENEVYYAVLEVRITNLDQLGYFNARPAMTIHGAIGWLVHPRYRRRGPTISMSISPSRP